MLQKIQHWNEYKTKIETVNVDNENLAKFLLDVSFQGVKRLFVLDFDNTPVNVANNPMNNTRNSVSKDSSRKYFLSRVNIANYNVLLDGRNFYDQPINDQIKKVWWD